MGEVKLPGSWIDAQLGEIVDYGKANKKALSDVEPNTWVLELEDIEKDSSKLLNQVEMSERPFKSTKNSFKKGDILYGKLRPYLNKVLIANKNGVCSTEIIPINAEPLCSNKYIFYWLKSSIFLRYVNDVSYGVNMPRLGTSDGNRAPFRLAPLAEQKIIAEKLGTLLAQVDSAKARLEQIPQILKRFRQSVLSAAVSGKLTEEWREERLLTIDDWLITCVGNIAQVATGKTPKRTEPKYWDNGSISWLTSSSTGNSITTSAEQFVTELALKECTLKLFGPGTLLLAMYGEGKTRGQVTELKLNAACNQACAAIIVIEEKVHRSFMKIRLMENYEETRKTAVGGNQPNLNLNKVREFSINLPSLEEQAQIVNRVGQLFAYADTIEKQVQAALLRVNNLTQSILAKAFRGELTAQWRAENPDLINGENSAEALLVRIKQERLKNKPVKRGKGNS